MLQYMSLSPYGFTNVDQNFPYVPINPPSTLPLTLEEVKSYLRLDPTDTSEDALLLLMIEAASDFCQKYTKLTFFTTTFDTFRDIFSATFQIRKYPVQSVTEIEFTPKGQTPIVIDPSNYTLLPSTLSFPYVEMNAIESVLPSVFLCLLTIRIRFVAGFGDDPSDIPAGLRLGMLQHIAAMYENRGDCSGCDSKSCELLLPTEAKNEYDIWRIRSIGMVRN